jgi:hypothetical protein
MEHLIYLVIKGLSVAYLLCNAYRFLSGKRMVNFWRFIMPEIKAKEKLPTTQKQAGYSIVGKSQTVYLEEPLKEVTKAIEPAFSEDLEKEEPETTVQDVDDNLHEAALSEADRFLPLNADSDDGDFPSSTGMSYEQISETLEVIQGKRADDAAQSITARILYEVQGSDLFNFLTAQAENEALIEKLLKENIDNNGIPLLENTKKQQRETEEFDLGKYV